MEWSGGVPIIDFAEGSNSFFFQHGNAKKGTDDRQAEKGLMLPLPSSSFCLLGMCKEKKRHRQRSPLSAAAAAK